MASTFADQMGASLGPNDPIPQQFEMADPSVQAPQFFADPSTSVPDGTMMPDGGGGDFGFEPEPEFGFEPQPQPQPQAPVPAQTGFQPMSPEELSAAKEALLDQREAAIRRAEAEHIQRLQQLQRQQPLVPAQPQGEVSPFEREVGRVVEQIVAPRLAQVQQATERRVAESTVQQALSAGLSSQDMPGFEQAARLAIETFGPEVVTKRLSTSAPQDGARWLYQLGATELRSRGAAAIPAPVQPQQQAKPAQQPQGRVALPRGMEVKGGGRAMDGTDWSQIDRRIGADPRYRAWMRKNRPAAYDRLLTYGSTNPNVPTAVPETWNN